MKHRRSLLPAEGKTSYSIHTKKVQMAGENKPVYVSALVVPNFEDNLISVGQLRKSNNVFFTENGAYLLTKVVVDSNARKIGGSGSDNLYTLSNDNITGNSSLRTTPATLKMPANEELYKTMNHSNPKELQEIKNKYPNSAKYSLKPLSKEKKLKSQSCEACTIGKAKRKPFGNGSTRKEQPLDAVETDTTGPIYPPDVDGNVFLQLVVDVASGHSKGFPCERSRNLLMTS